MRPAPLGAPRLSALELLTALHILVVVQVEVVLGHPVDHHLAQGIRVVLLPEVVAAVGAVLGEIRVDKVVEAVEEPVELVEMQGPFCLLLLLLVEARGVAQLTIDRELPEILLRVRTAILC